MTPRETFNVIDAYFWQNEQQWKRDATIAWLTALLTRTKRMPPLKKILSNAQTKKLSGRELQKRRQEFKQMTKNIDMSKINKVKNG